MKRWQTLAVVTLVLAAGLPPAIAGNHEESRSSREYVVGFHELPDNRERYKGEPVEAVDEALGYLLVHADDPNRFERKAKADEDVRYLEENQAEVELAFTPDDPRFSDQYGPQITDTESAWDTTLGSTAVSVGFLDSGITAGHDDLVDSRIDGHDYVNDDGTPEDEEACGYHGTHVAGIASATTDNGVGISGMSQHAVTLQKIFDDDSGSCAGATIHQIAQALEDLGDAGAHLSSNSWGLGGASTTINEAIDYAHDRGVIHVASAGNDGECTDCVSEPWASRPSKVVIVSCTDSSDAFCSFSSQGPEVDVAGPGRSVLSLDGGSTTGYTTKSGTSMSAPHVTGAAALYIDAKGDVSHSTMETRIGESADDVGLSAERQGAGRLNTGALVPETNGAPQADFTSTCEDLACTFEASSSSDSDGNITSYDWEFGDGATATGETVDHTYATGGDYTVNLTVTDDDGATDTTSQTVSVSPNSAPTAEFSSSCEDLDCSFEASASSDPDGSIASYEWDFGDGSTATGETVDHTYGANGTYTVTLTVTDDDGATDQASQDVEVTANQPPTATFSVSCQDLECTFDGTNASDPDGSIASYEWDFGDGSSSTASTVTHIYPAEGNYTATLTVTDDDGATATASQTVSVQNTPDLAHVHAIDHASQGIDVVVTVNVSNELGEPVSGATVDVQTCRTVLLCIERSAETGDDGRAEIRWENALAGEFTSCVQSLQHPELSYDSGSDHARDGSCETERILI